MPHCLRKIARAVPVAGVALAAVLAGCAAPGCRNTLAQRVVSPDAQHDAVVYHRDCGRGEGASSGVAIIPHDADLPDLPTPVLTLSQPVNVTPTWTSATELRLSYPASATVVASMASSPEGVTVLMQPRR